MHSLKWSLRFRMRWMAKLSQHIKDQETCEQFTDKKSCRSKIDILNVTIKRAGVLIISEPGPPAAGLRRVSHQEAESESKLFCSILGEKRDDENTSDYNIKN